MVFSKNKEKEIINLVKMIQDMVGLKGWDMPYYFTKDFTSNCIPMRVTLRNSLSPTKRVRKIYESYGIYDYLKRMDIGSTDKASYIFSILHEFGHIEQSIIFDINDKESNVYKLDSLNEVSLCVLDNIKTISKDIRYYNTYVELYANQFAYKWFPIVWNDLVYEILDVLDISE